mgnify:CR=1 FL=1
MRKKCDETFDRYVAYLTFSLIIFFVVVCVLFFLQVLVGFLCAVSMGGVI